MALHSLSCLSAGPLAGGCGARRQEAWAEAPGRGGHIDGRPDRARRLQRPPPTANPACKGPVPWKRPLVSDSFGVWLLNAHHPDMK